MPEAWRIVKTKYASTAFSGEGARLYGGRWTSVDLPAVYVSSTVALATLEMLVHLESSLPLPAYSLIPVSIPERVVEALNPIALPGNWRSYPAPASLQRLGDRWIEESRSAALKVPSAIVANEFNFLLNPLHSDFRTIKIGAAVPYTMDPRLKR